MSVLEQARQARSELFRNNYYTTVRSSLETYLLSMAAIVTEDNASPDITGATAIMQPPTYAVTFGGDGTATISSLLTNLSDNLATLTAWLVNTLTRTAGAGIVAIDPNSGGWSTYSWDWAYFKSTDFANASPLWIAEFADFVQTVATTSVVNEADSIYNIVEYVRVLCLEIALNFGGGVKRVSTALYNTLQTQRDRICCVLYVACHLEFLAMSWRFATAFSDLTADQTHDVSDNLTGLDDEFTSFLNVFEFRVMKYFYATWYLFPVAYSFVCANDTDPTLGATYTKLKNFLNKTVFTNNLLRHLMDRPTIADIANGYADALNAANPPSKTPGTANLVPNIADVPNLITGVKDMIYVRFSSTYDAGTHPFYIFSSDVAADFGSNSATDNLVQILWGDMAIIPSGLYMGDVVTAADEVTTLMMTAFAQAGGGPTTDAYLMLLSIDSTIWWPEFDHAPNSNGGGGGNQTVTIMLNNDALISYQLDSALVSGLEDEVADIMAVRNLMSMPTNILGAVAKLQEAMQTVLTFADQNGAAFCNAAAAWPAAPSIASQLSDAATTISSTQDKYVSVLQVNDARSIIDLLLCIRCLYQYRASVAQYNATTDHPRAAVQMIGRLVQACGRGSLVVADAPDGTAHTISLAMVDQICASLAGLQAVFDAETAALRDETTLPVKNQTIDASLANTCVEAKACLVAIMGAVGITGVLPAAAEDMVMPMSRAGITSTLAAFNAMYESYAVYLTEYALAAHVSPEPTLFDKAMASRGRLMKLMTDPALVALSPIGLVSRVTATSYRFSSFFSNLDYIIDDANVLVGQANALLQDVNPASVQFFKTADKLLTRLTLLKSALPLITAKVNGILTSKAQTELALKNSTEALAAVIKNVTSFHSYYTGLLSAVEPRWKP